MFCPHVQSQEVQEVEEMEATVAILQEVELEDEFVDAKGKQEAIQRGSGISINISNYWFLVPDVLFLAAFANQKQLILNGLLEAQVQ